MKNPSQKSPQSALLGITICLVPDLTKETLFDLTGGTKGLRMRIRRDHSLKQFVKHFYLPIRGVPDGAICASIAGNHLSAILGPGNSEADISGVRIVEGVLPDEVRAQKVIENLKQCLSVELNVFVHKH